MKKQNELSYAIIIFFFIFGLILMSDSVLAQISNEVSVSAIVPQNQQNIIEQGGSVAPFFLQYSSASLPEKINLRKAKLILSGRTSPGAHLTVKLVQLDAYFDFYANSKGDFYIEKLALLNNYYDILIESRDVFGIKSNALTFPIKILPGDNKKEGIFLSPTINLEFSEIIQGQNLKIFGTSYPFSTIIINTNEFNSEQNSQFFAQSDALGRWQFEIPTANFKPKTYFISVFAQTSKGDISLKSQNLVFRILSRKNILPQTKVSNVQKNLSTFDIKIDAKTIKQVDLSQDQKIGLKDLSILLANWGKVFKDKRVDLNNDGKIDLKDLSIMMFYWTM